MPHIAIGMLPGRNMELKKKLARKMREVLAEELNINEMIVSVSIEDVEMKDWGSFMERIPDNTILIPEEKKDDEKYQKGTCCCC